VRVVKVIGITLAILTAICVLVIFSWGVGYIQGSSDNAAANRAERQEHLFDNCYVSVEPLR
jgi:hypothetical protein